MLPTKNMIKILIEMFEQIWNDFELVELITNETSAINFFELGIFHKVFTFNLSQLSIPYTYLEKHKKSHSMKLHYSYSDRGKPITSFLI